MVELNDAQIKHETFEKAMDILASNNGMFDLLKIECWPKFLNYHYINSMLNKLDDKQLVIFLTGETDEMQEIADDYELNDISDLFDDIFDGFLSKYFFGE